jgi:dUTP pyrophosphatase|tara:strand:- start:434 stop:901 length:468 start_codon:yes stop_codon:yes gene_type:complete
MVHIKILPDNQEVQALYENHSTYHDGDSGLDLFFPDEINVGPKETKLINLKIKCEARNELRETERTMMVSYYLYPRSSISKTPLRMSNSVGIIDAGYRGNLMVSVDNISEDTVIIEKGSRLFQICGPTLSRITFELTDTLSETSRGEGGFGSTNQ